MKAASAPRAARDVRVLAVDGASGAMSVVAAGELASLFRRGDLLVVNDAATLPASFFAETAGGAAVELRLLGHESDRRWTAILFGRGDWRTRTEDRPAPPPLSVGDRLRIGDAIDVEILRVHEESPRLVDVELSSGESVADLWAALYRAGRPVQYAHVPEPLALWDVQNVYAARPWAVEMPSAGRGFRAATVAALRAHGVEIATLTHAAGLSASGDIEIDRRLPLPERYEIPEATWEAIARCRAAGGRVVAIGTSVVRALEGALLAARPLAGVTDLHIGPQTRRAVVDAVVTGVHDVETSHFELLSSFAERALLERVLARADTEGLLGHELGDLCLVWGQPRENLARRPAARVSATPST